LPTWAGSATLGCGWLALLNASHPLQAWVDAGYEHTSLRIPGDSAASGSNCEPCNECSWETWVFCAGLVFCVKHAHTDLVHQCVVRNPKAHSPHTHNASSSPCRPPLAPQPGCSWPPDLELWHSTPLQGQPKATDAMDTKAERHAEPARLKQGLFAEVSVLVKLKINVS